MANDFKVLFGLEYDDSDKLIRSQLNEIAKKISKDGLLQVAVTIDSNIQNTLQDQLQKMLDKMQLSVGVSAQNIGVGVSKKEVESTSKEVDNQAKSYKKLNRILTETYRMSKDADVGKFKGFIDASTLDDIKILKTSAEALMDGYDSGNIQGFTKDVENLSDRLGGLKEDWNRMTKDKQSNTWAYQQSINFKNLESQAQNYFTKFGANIRKSPELLDQYTEFFDKLNKGSFKTDKEASEYYKSMIKGFRAAGVEVETFSGKLKELFNKHIKTTLAMAAIGMLSRGLRLVYRNVLDIDLAMTELKKVTDLTDKQYSKFLDNANTRAIKLGATIKDVVNATSEFVKLGFTVDDASAIADAALIYKNVGDGIHSINDASQAIISTLKSFKIPASEALEIVDRYNEVSNKFSVTSADIGAILSRSASALSAAGNDINQAIGLGVAGNAVVQNAENVGTVLSTLSMRIRGASKSLVDAGLDTEGMAKSTSDLRQRIIELTDVTRDGSGFDMMIDDSTFKSTYEILKGISEVYGSMENIERAELLELLAGKRNANVTESILRNFDDAEAAMKVSMDSYGSALAENEKRLDSIRGRTRQLQAAFESLSTTVINSELVKGGIGFLRTAVQLVDAFATTFGTLPTLIGAVTAGLSLRGQNAGILTLFQRTDDWNVLGNKVLGVSDKINFLGKSMRSVKKEFKDTDGFKNKISGLFESQAKRDAKNSLESDIAALGELKNKLAQGMPFQEAFNATMTKASVTARRYAVQAHETGIKVGEFTKKQNAAKASTVGLTLAATAMNMALTMGASLIISGTFKLLTNWINASKIAIDKAKELTDAWAETRNKLVEMDKTIKSISDRYEVLARGVDNLGNNIALTTDQYTEYNEIAKKIADMFPQMVTGYTKEGHAIIALKGNVEELTKAYGEAQEAQAYQTRLDADDAWKGYRKVTNKKTSWGWQDTGYSNQLDTVQGLIKALNVGEDAYKKFINKNIVPFGASTTGLIDRAIDDIEEKIGSLDTSSYERAKKELSTLYDMQKDLVNKMNIETAKITPIISAFLKDPNSEVGFSYLKLSSDAQKVIDEIIGKFDYAFYGRDEFKKKDDVLDWIYENLISQFTGEKGDKITEAFNDLAKLDKNLPVKDWQKQANDLYNTLIEGLGWASDSDEAIELKLNLKLAVKDENGNLVEATDKTISDIIDRIVPKTTSNVTDRFVPKTYGSRRHFEDAQKNRAGVEEWLNTLTQEELNIVYSLTPADGSASLEEMQKILADEQKRLAEAAKIKEASQGFQDLYDEFQFNLSAGKATQQEYFRWLEEAYEKAYGHDARLASGDSALREEYLKKWRQYHLEVQKLRNDAAKEELDIIQRTINSMKRAGVEEEKIIEQYKDLRTKAYGEIRRLINAGFAMRDSEVQAFVKIWEDAYDAIYAAQKEQIEKSKTLLEQQINSVEDIISKTVNIIKREQEKIIDGLNDQKQAYSDIIDERKKLIQSMADEDKHLDNLNEKNTDIAKIRSRLAILEKDTSAEAGAERDRLNDQLLKSEKDLADYQKEYTIKQQLEALDEMKDAHNETIDEQIESIRRYLSEEGTLRKDAMDKIREEGKKLYDKLIEYNSIYGTGIDNDITEAWQGAMSALEDYNYKQSNSLDVLVKMNKQLSEYKKQSESIQASNALAEQNKIIDEMLIYSARSKTAKPGSDEHHAAFKAYMDLGSRFKTIVGDAVKFDVRKGEWTMDGESLYNLPKYHSGGFVGGSPSSANGEIIAKVMSGEYVMDQAKIDRFVRQTLPSLATAGGSLTVEKLMDVTFTGNIDQSTLPDMKKYITSAAQEAASLLVKTMSRKGIKPSVKNIAF